MFIALFHLATFTWRSKSMQSDRLIVVEPGKIALQKADVDERVHP